MSQAITEMNQLYIDGSMLTVRAADDGPPTMHNNAAGGGRRGGAERKPTRRQNEPNKLFVGGLPYDVDNESLVRTREIHQYYATSPGASVLEVWPVSLVSMLGWMDGVQAAAFEGFGELSSATVVMDEDDQSRGFGFVVPPCPPARHIHLHCLAVSAVPMVPSAYIC